MEFSPLEVDKVSPGGTRKGHTEEDMVEQRLELKGGCMPCNYLNKKESR